MRGDTSTPRNARSSQRSLLFLTHKRRSETPLIPCDANFASSIRPLLFVVVFRRFKIKEAVAKQSSLSNVQYVCKGENQ